MELTKKEIYNKEHNGVNFFVGVKYSKSEEDYKNGIYEEIKVFEFWEFSRGPLNIIKKIKNYNKNKNYGYWDYSEIDKETFLKYS